MEQITISRKRSGNMTDKEFKRLSRSELIDIIYQFQLQIDGLTEKNQALEQELADKRLRLRDAGNIAEAALAMNDCFRNAQSAAELYLQEIQCIREETETQRQQILAQAQAEAAQILENAKKAHNDYDLAVEAILREYKQSHSDLG
jgi:cell division septum initiation protein DivIVA